MRRIAALKGDRGHQTIANRANKQCQNQDLRSAFSSDRPIARSARSRPIAAALSFAPESVPPGKSVTEYQPAPRLIGRSLPAFPSSLQVAPLGRPHLVNSLVM